MKLKLASACLLVILSGFWLHSPLYAQQVYGYSDFVTDPYAGTTTAFATISTDYTTSYYYGTQVHCWVTDVAGTSLGHSAVGAGLPTASVDFSSQQQHSVKITGAFVLLVYFYGECGYYDEYNYELWTDYSVDEPFAYNFYAYRPLVCTEIYAIELGSVFTVYSTSHQYSDDFLYEL